MVSKIVEVFTAIMLSLTVFFGGSTADRPKRQEYANTNYRYVFVHGLSGWGSYDAANQLVAYWGMLSGDLMGYLNRQGFACCAASVAPIGSAWDRACELYAQLTGTVTDYGKAHSARCGHDRYGKDYSRFPLITDWSAENKINILGHSFGGVTVRLLAELMANGSDAERAATDARELSPLFAGGKADWIYSVTTLAAPHNGTTAYSIDPKLTTETATTPKAYVQGLMTQVIPVATTDHFPDRVETDYASYDMDIDHALALNETISTLANVYYFSVPCSASDPDADGVYAPDEEIMESLFVRSSVLMGAFTGETENGFVIDETWRENDGLVNTVSAMAPLGAPQQAFDRTDIRPGVWNVMPTYRGDHMALQGGLLKKNKNIRAFYVDLLNLINSL